mgnify:FL=1
MYLKETTSQGVIEIDLHGITGLGFLVSGGMDSATLLYTLCESMTLQNQYIPMYCISACNSTDVFGAYHAGLVINFCQRKFPNVVIEHIVDYSLLTGKYKIERKRKVLAKLYSSKKITAHIDGVTMNPKADFVYEHINPKCTPPEEKRNTPLPIRLHRNGRQLIRPWGKLDKKGVREIAEKKRIKDKLLAITRSCTDIHYHVCGQCWWCQERKWAYPEEKKSRIQRVLRKKR